MSKSNHTEAQMIEGLDQVTLPDSDAHLLHANCKLQRVFEKSGIQLLVEHRVPADSE